MSCRAVPHAKLTKSSEICVGKLAVSAQGPYSVQRTASSDSSLLAYCKVRSKPILTGGCASTSRPRFGVPIETNPSQKSRAFRGIIPSDQYGSEVNHSKQGSGSVHTTERIQQFMLCRLLITHMPTASKLLSSCHTTPNPFNIFPRPSACWNKGLH
jgi:hypothetical protein